MAEDILNKETAVQRMRERMVQRRRAALDHRITAVLVISFVILALLIAGSTWALLSLNETLQLPDSVVIHDLVVSDRDELKQSDFVEGLEDTGISIEYIAYSEERLGWQEVAIKFVRDQKSCTKKTTLYRFSLKPSLIVELGKETQVTARDYVPDETIDATLKAPLQEGKGGNFTLELLCNGREYTVQCLVTENISPEGTAQEVTVEAGTLPEPVDFVTGLKDHSPVTVSYKTTPEFVMLGACPVTVVLTDYFGNRTEVVSVAKVVPSPNGPQFAGLETIYLQQGTAVSYKNGVSVTDAQDGELTFTVDPGDLNAQVPGNYTVYYSAVDSDGNRVIAPRNVVVESRTGQLLREKMQQVLDSIIEPGMTRDEQIRAVFTYARWNVTYIGTSEKSSIENAAYQGFTQRQGDCYTYYAMIRLMLDALEIPNLECQRVGGTSDHWWNLVQFEDGKYYHVDATPHAITWIEHFKMTESTIVQYTQNPDVANHRPNYYVYDHTLPEYQDIEIAQ